MRSLTYNLNIQILEIDEIVKCLTNDIDEIVTCLLMIFNFLITNTFKFTN